MEIYPAKHAHREVQMTTLNQAYMMLFILGDFGIAKMMENTFDMAQTCCGTPCYLSPELCQDMPYSSKADVWVKSLCLSENFPKYSKKALQICNIPK